MSYVRTITIVVILVITSVLTLAVSRSERKVLNKPFALFPEEIERWKGVKGTLDQEIYNILGVEDYILANYKNPNGNTINLYVGFYQSQKEGDLIHSPKNCLPGAGWNIVKSSEEPIAFENNQVFVSRLLLQKGVEQQIVLYWFQSRGRIISSEYMQKIWLVVDSITKQRTDGSFVRLISPILDNEQVTVDLLKEFAKQIKPILDDHIPS
ncbi:MAG: EpsI family protein [Proteobacteria bacterium]|nr:EpsI family protein [Desulfobacula sp.]MBU3952354.1 EpsI family protein [Pseudomonadota bacterium]MBU4130859.1 EpsI family protein [Pseudomonadota bacterium]